MLAEALAGLSLGGVSRLVVAVLREHVEKYRFLGGLREQIADARLEFAVLDKPTQSQPETVAKALEQARVSGPFAVKDTDNYFRADLPDANFVCCYDIARMTGVTPGNKSYVVESEGLVKSIVEKRVVSSRFCCGAYGFAAADEYLHHYWASPTECRYLSDVITRMLAGGARFRVVDATDYEDWGTMPDWQRYRATHGTLLLDVDGVLVENGGAFCAPFWWEKKSIAENVRVVNERFNSGRWHIILLTSRPPSQAAETERQLAEAGVLYHRIMFGLLHARRVLVNDFSRTNPYRSCEAVNLPRDSPTLGELL